MRKNNIFKNVFSCFFAVALILQMFNLPVWADSKAESTSDKNDEYSFVSDYGSYEEYLALYDKYAESDIQIPLTQLSYSERVSVKDGAIEFSKESASAGWSVIAEQAGFYNMVIEYSPIVDLGKQMQLMVEINGECPYDEASRIILEQVWIDDLSEDGAFKTDSDGNDILPDAIQLDSKNTYSFYDNEGYYSLPLMFYLEKGKNEITFNSLGDAFILYKASLVPPEKYISYEEYKKDVLSANAEDDNNYIQIIQAEHPTKKSDSSLYAANDKTDPLIEPSSNYGSKRNVIGTNNWKNSGQYLEWEFEVPTDGYYKLGFKYRQNANRGLYNLRKLYIDGSIPFEEALNIKFEYCDGYNILVPGNGKEDYLFYLKKGSHTIRLEVTLGEIASTLRTVENVRSRLSNLVQRIMMVTSANPDLYRDYYLEDQIPILVSELNDIADILSEQMQSYEESTGQKGSNAITLGETADQLYEFAKKTYLIPEKLSALSSCVSNLATWINGQREQLLELDYIVVAAPQTEMPKAQASFFSKLIYEIKMTIYSYAKGYSKSGASDEEIEVWISGGRDQRDILRELINSSELSFPVNLKLTTTSITNAIMAGIGPDVVLNLAHTEPINLGMRGALEPLNKYDGFEELKNQFSKEAFVPYQLEEKIFALPETETFNVLFIRTDIFARLDLSVPETWDEFFSINRILQQNKMEAGLPSNFFATLLYQKGGSYFNKEHTALNFDNDTALSVFSQWIELYTEYSFSLFKDDYNRFRTGEMPMMISPYSMYSKIYAAAPEIRNNWQMYMIPGEKQADRTIDRTNVGDVTGTASVILADSQNKQNAWKFIKWWAGGDTQAAFGNRIEYVMGVAGRYTPANITAFKKLPWSSSELEIILKQWEDVKQLPEVPGGYYVSRNIDNAFRACTTRGEDIKETFTYWTQETNKEITRKRNRYVNN